jgi:hypothetical protein
MTIFLEAIARRTEYFCAVHVWKEQANGLVPYLRAQPTRLSILLYAPIRSHGKESGYSSTLAPQGFSKEALWMVR